jgi:3-phenylpropionate/cinnamic acid dioxygenase small subunit
MSIQATQVLPQIEALLRDYCHALDDGEVDRWSGFFQDQATYQITTRENLARGYPLGIMLCEGRGMMRDRIKALQTANIFESHTYCHLWGAPDVRPEIEGRWSVRSNFAVYRTMYSGEQSLFATGKYLDVVDTTGAQALFAERIVVIDSRQVDTLLVYPL